jgi:hypothetical protein
MQEQLDTASGVVSVSVNKPVNLSQPVVFYLANNGTQARSKQASIPTLQLRTSTYISGSMTCPVGWLYACWPSLECFLCLLELSWPSVGSGNWSKYLLDQANGFLVNFDKSEVSWCSLGSAVSWDRWVHVEYRVLISDINIIVGHSGLNCWPAGLAH